MEPEKSVRQRPPAHFTLKVKSYSLLSELHGKYDSPYFEAGGYKWRLLFYPKGGRNPSSLKCISLYLAICETDNLPSGWQVDVNFNFFVYNHKHNNYSTFQATGFFDCMRSEWGFEPLLSFETFKDLSKGYLLNDSCVFGVEVFVISPTLNSASLSLFRRDDIRNPTFRWEIKFSNIGESLLNSEVFSSGFAKWHLSVHMDCGDPFYDSLVLSLFFVDGGITNTKSSIFASYCLRVIDQLNSKHEEVSENYWFSHRSYDECYIMLSDDFYESSTGYVVRDTLIVEVEFFVMSRTEVSQS